MITRPTSRARRVTIPAAAAGQQIPAGANYWGALVHGEYIYTGDFGARGLDVFQFVPPED